MGSSVKSENMALESISNVILVRSKTSDSRAPQHLQGDVVGSEAIINGSNSSEVDL